MQETIHVIRASQKTKAELIALVFDREEWGFIEPNIPERLWNENGGNCHPPVTVIDKRANKPVQIIEEGIKRGVFYKTKI